MSKYLIKYRIQKQYRYDRWEFLQKLGLTESLKKLLEASFEIQPKTNGIKIKELRF